MKIIFTWLAKNKNNLIENNFTQNYYVGCVFQSVFRRLSVIKKTSENKEKKIIQTTTV